MAYKSDSGVINIKAEIDDAKKFFDGLNVNEKTITKQLLKTTGSGGLSRIRRGYNSVLNKRSGTLYKSLKYVIRDNNTKVVFTNTANSGKKTSKDGRLAYYGFMLASGYDVTAKEGRWLTFNVNGKWARVKQIHVAPRDFVEGPIDRFMESGDLDRRLDTTFQKQVERVEKKMGVSLS